MHCVRACIIKAKRKECVNLDDIICINGEISDDKRFFVFRNEKRFFLLLRLRPWDGDWQ